MYNEQRKKHGQTRKAIAETIRICKDRNVLKEYLESRETEVVDMMMTLFDDDYILEAYIEDIAREREDRATNRAARRTAEKLIRKGQMSLEDIADCVPSLSFDELKELEAEVMQLA